MDVPPALAEGLYPGSMCRYSHIAWGLLDMLAVSNKSWIDWNYAI